MISQMVAAPWTSPMMLLCEPLLGVSLARAPTQELWNISTPLQVLKNYSFSPLPNSLLYQQHHGKHGTRIYAWKRHHPTRTVNRVSCCTDSPSSSCMVLDFRKPLWFCMSTGSVCMSFLIILGCAYYAWAKLCSYTLKGKETGRALQMGWGKRQRPGLPPPYSNWHFSL